MKDERNVRRRRTAGGRWQPVAILLAAVLMVLSVPLGIKSAHAIDLNESCSLTVTPGNTILAEDLANANVVIDLYRVADAVPVEGYDTYDWSMNDPFYPITIDKEIDSEGWKQAAQQAADIALGTAPDGETAWDPSDNTDKIEADLKSTGNAAGTEITGLKAGLYLIVAHSVVDGANDPEKYAEVAVDEDGNAGGTVTIANSHTYKYSFTPELISLPTKDANEAGVINTGNSGPWVYNASVTLKPSQEVRVGNLEIIKNLPDYAQREKTLEDGVTTIKDPATFVFEVTAYENEDMETVVLHDYVSITFEGFGSESITIKDLPVDSYVVVKEVYSGRIYEAQADEDTATIVADDTVDVEFTNEYQEREPGGGSVTNNFSYSENDGWALKVVSDNTEESMADPYKTFENQ